MSCTQKVEYALLGPFQNGIERLCRVDVTIVPAELFKAMVDRVMSRIFLADRLVCRQLIGHETGSWGNHLCNPKDQVSIAVSGDDISFDFSLALDSNMYAAFPSSFAARIGNPRYEARPTAQIFLV